MVGLAASQKEGERQKDTSEGGESMSGYSQRTVRRGFRTGSTKLKPKPRPRSHGSMPMRSNYG